MKISKSTPSPRGTGPAGKPLRLCPLLIHLSLTQSEIQTLHRALERDYQIGTLFGKEAGSAEYFLTRSVEVELEMQLHTNHTGVLRWLNGTTKQEAAL